MLAKKYNLKSIRDNLNTNISIFNTNPHGDRQNYPYRPCNF
jgi:hypothetical protein